jgi:cell growth-regulating nucleolar protein
MRKGKYQKQCRKWNRRLNPNKIPNTKYFFILPQIIYTDDYRLHTSCISEAERYEKSGAKPKKTKRNPQQEWMDIVETCVPSAPSHLRDHMLTMSQLDNVPRQEKKFVNFASNSLHLRGSNRNIVSEIWSHLRKEKEKRIAEKEKKELIEKEKQEQKEKLIASTKPKEKNGPSSSCDNNTNNASIDAKKVKKITKKTLKKAPNKSMRMKDLRKIIKREMDLPESAKKRLKLILLETAKTSKNRIKIDGELMSLS